MKYNISFEERAKLARELLLKQPPTTLEQARAQAQRVQKRIVDKVKKTKSNIDKKSR